METYLSDVIGCVIWDIQKTSLGHTNGASWIRATETSWWRTNETSLGVWLETCLRRREDVPMRHHCDVLLRCLHDVPIRCREDLPLRRLGDVPSKRLWVFDLRRTCDVAATYTETSLRRRHDVLVLGGLQMNVQKFANGKSGRME